MEGYFNSIENRQLFVEEMRWLRSNKTDLYKKAYANCVKVCGKHTFIGPYNQWERYKKNIEIVLFYFIDMIDLAPEGFAWPDKKSVAERKNPPGTKWLYGAIEISLLLSFVRDEWTSEELKSIAEKIPPFAYSFLTPSERSFVGENAGGNKSIFEVVEKHLAKGKDEGKYSQDVDLRNLCYVAEKGAREWIRSLLYEGPLHRRISFSTLLKMPSRDCE